LVVVRVAEVRHLVALDKVVAQAVVDLTILQIILVVQELQVKETLAALVVAVEHRILAVVAVALAQLELAVHQAVLAELV
jgi:hypothetical protein